MLKKLNLGGFLNDVENFLKNNKSLLAIIASILFLLIVIISLVLFVKSKKQPKVSIPDKRKLSIENLKNDLADHVIEWVESYSSKNSFLNDQYEKFIRNICLESEDLRKKLFDESALMENSYRMRDFVLYDNMRIIERGGGIEKIRSNYPLLHKEMKISKEELNLYISKYIGEKPDEAKASLSKMKSLSRFRYSDLEKSLDDYQKTKVLNSHLEFFFIQMKIVDVQFDRTINELIEKEKENYITNSKRDSVTCTSAIVNALEKKIISKDKFQGIINDLYRKFYDMNNRLAEKILQWMRGGNKKFCEGENCDYYEQIFASLIFKIAHYNNESKLIDYVSEFKNQHQINSEKKLSEFFKSKLESQEIKELEVTELVANFTLYNLEEAYCFDALLDEKTKLISIQNDKSKFAVDHIDNTKSQHKGFKNKLKDFVQNTFNNSNH
jgi:hypothetical protein